MGQHSWSWVVKANSADELNDQIGTLVDECIEHLNNNHCLNPNDNFHKLVAITVTPVTNRLGVCPVQEFSVWAMFEEM